MRRWFVAAFLAVLALGALLRLPGLALRPLHNDEAVNAIKFRGLWTANSYKYDPNEFHGPTLPYFTLPAAWLSGTHDYDDLYEANYRVVTAVFGIGLIALLLLLTKEFGRLEVLWAALFTAISPAMVFYSRYYIHEMLLVFFTAGAAICGWRWRRSGRPGWAVASGICVGLMSATKETFVFAILSMILAAIATILWSKWRGTKSEKYPKLHWKSLVAGAAAAIVVAALFFSSFFSNPAGLMDAIKTYAPWFQRAGGATAHVHPWYYYFQHLFFYKMKGGPLWTEGLVAVLGLVGFIAALRGNINSEPSPTSTETLGRFISFYVVCLTAIYTLLPYKTPWCLLGFYHGMILLAGIGAVVLVRMAKSPAARGGVILVLLVASAQLGWQAWRGSFASDKGGVPYCDSAKNPYTYSQTTPDIYRLMQTINAVATASPTTFNTVIEVMSPDSYWPLPWYLRRYHHVGFWDKIPDQPPAPIMVVSTELHAGFDERPERSHLMAGYFELRPNVFFELYVSVDLWSRYLSKLPPEKE